MHLRRIPVVVLGGEERMSEVDACMDLGAKEYLIKPLRHEMAPTLLKYARDRYVPTYLSRWPVLALI